MHGLVLAKLGDEHQPIFGNLLPVSFFYHITHHGCIAVCDDETVGKLFTFFAC